MEGLVKRQSQALRELEELGAFTQGSSFGWKTVELTDSMGNSTGSLWALQQLVAIQTHHFFGDLKSFIALAFLCSLFMLAVI